MSITTHVLDLAAGRPGVGIPVRLERKSGEGWEPIGQGKTDADGRCKSLIGSEDVAATGHYRLVFGTGAYFSLNGVDTFFPEVTIEFIVEDPAQHYHVPLLLSPFGYSTYRGS